EIVTHGFTLIVLSALRRSDNENMLSLTILILRSILLDLQETLKRRWRYLIPAESQIHNHMLIPNYQDIKFKDFHYSDGFECYQAIKIGRYEHCKSTRSNSSYLFSPLRDPESLIRGRNLGEPSSLFDFEEVINHNHNQEPSPYNGPPPKVRPNGQAPRTMEELCQPSINGRGGPIAPIPIQATDFGLRHHMIQQVQNTCQFHGLPGDDANRNIDKFLEITQRMKQNGVSDDDLRLSLFPYSLTYHAVAWYDHLLRNSIHSFDDMMRKFLSKYISPSMVTKLRNEIRKFEQKQHESLFEAWERYKL
nr:reverse transcriptase domain-containing protein [Tanacetum cinerariifolium]